MVLNRFDSTRKNSPGKCTPLVPVVLEGETRTAKPYENDSHGYLVCDVISYEILVSSSIYMLIPFQSHYKHKPLIHLNHVEL